MAAGSVKTEAFAPIPVSIMLNVPMSRV